MVNKVLPFAKTFYSGYSLVFFLFNNIVSLFVFVQDTLYITLMNKQMVG